MMALELLDLKTRYPLKLEEFNITTSPVALGYMMIQRLEHVSEKKISSRSFGPYTSKVLAPTSGKKRDGGQKIGELDVFSLLSWDVPFVIEELLGPMSSDHPTKNIMVSELIQKGRTNFRQSKTNPVKEQLSQYMLALHLTSS
jgi:DNA-directed RNA polymerase beta subunit